MTQNEKGYLASSAIKFNYDDPAPTNTKINILTKGNVCITSIWHNGCGHKAWAPLPDRDKERERELGML